MALNYRAQGVIRCWVYSFQVCSTAAKHRESPCHVQQRGGHAINLNKDFVPHVTESNMNGQPWWSLRFI